MKKKKKKEKRKKEVGRKKKKKKRSEYISCDEVQYVRVGRSVGRQSVFLRVKFPSQVPY